MNKASVTAKSKSLSTTCQRFKCFFFFIFIKASMRDGAVNEMKLHS
jgi:hypothetical protein